MQIKPPSVYILIKYTVPLGVKLRCHIKPDANCFDCLAGNIIAITPEKISEQCHYSYDSDNYCACQPYLLCNALLNITR